MMKHNKLVIDIETYWSKDVGFSAGHCVWEYILNPEFYCTAVAYKQDNNNTQVAVLPTPDQVGIQGHREALKKLLLDIGYMESKVVVAHNGAFDFPSLSFLTGLTPPMMHCTMLADLYLNGQSEKIPNTKKTMASGGSLEGVFQTQVLGKGKDNFSSKDRSALIDTKGKHPALLDKETLDSFIEYAKSDVDKCSDIFNALAPVVPTIRRYAIHWALRQMSQPRLMFDADRAEELFSEASVQMQQELLDIGVTEEQLRSAQKFHTLMQKYYEPIGKPWPIVQKGKGTGPLMAKSDPLWKEILGDVNTPETVKKIMTLRGIVTAQSRDKRIARYCDISRLLNGYWPVHVIPSGAHTHRLTGGSGSGGNPLNLPREGSVRSCIHAPPGHTLFVGDYSGMELRIARWMGRDKGGKEAVLEGRDLYIESAAWSLGIKPEEVTKDQRHIGKITQLSAQFGVGARRLAQSCGIDEQTAKKFIDSFRQELHADLPKAWNACNEILVAWVNQQVPNKRVAEALNLPKGTQITADGRVIWPSGCTLHYKDMGYEEQQLAYNPRGSATHKIYGPLFFENLVQSYANELMWASQYRVERAGFDVCFQVYDEVIVLLKEDGTEHDKAKEIAAIMQQPITEWPDSPPMDVDYSLARVYSDAK